MLSVKPSIKIVATILFRNEEDILGPMIEHHIEQGVTQFIVTDNASTDNSRAVTARYPEVVEIIDEPDDTHNQSVWVTRMARLACRLNPDWIVHLDADEFWCNLAKLKNLTTEVAHCQTMYLHPPNRENMKSYLDFDQIPIPQETKVAHRPNPQITVLHGNHGVLGDLSVTNTKVVSRHHYPIRSLTQWERKAKGHLALMKRNAPCERWRQWHDLLEKSELSSSYTTLLDAWADYRQSPNYHSFRTLLNYWATPEMVEFFTGNQGLLPAIKEWDYEK